MGLWQDGCHRCHLVLATVKGLKESWVAIADEIPSLNTLCQYALRFRVEELFLDSKSGAFKERRFSPAFCRSLGTSILGCCCGSPGITQGMAVPLAGLRQQVDPHWSRSYLKIARRWLKGFLTKGRTLLTPVPLLPRNPQPCFASNKAEYDYYD